MGKKKLLIILGIIFVLVSLLTVGSWLYIRSTKKSKSTQKQVQTNTDPTYQSSYLSVSDIDKKSISKEEKQSLYDSTAAALVISGDGNKAFDYYDAQAQLLSSDPTAVQQINYSAYTLAKRLNNTDKMKKYEALLGAEKLKELEGSVIKIDE